MRSLAILLGLLTLSVPSFGQEGMGGGGLIFSRERVFISTQVDLPPAPKEGVETKEEEKKPDGPTTEQRKYYFDTEVRDEEGLRLEWFLSLANLPDGKATMIVFKEAEPRFLPEAKIYKPIDVLVIGDDGSILAILPKIVLANQPKQISMDMPIKALMYIKEGAAEQLQIKPKDMVQHRMFTANPTVLQ